MIQINNISKSFAGDPLLEDISFNISPGEKIGLVGRNGCGKSTLFKMILGTESIDSGEIVIPNHYRIGSLEQHISFSKPTVLEECVQYLNKEDQYDHYKVERILSGLGFSENDFNKDPHSFSGGYQVRISLTKALIKNPDLLLLDEPTNYLDIVSINWLKGFLKSYPSEVVIITHDKTFMDSVVTHIIGIKRRNIKKIAGTTDKYYQQIQHEEELFEQTRLNINKKKKDIQEFVDKFRASASKASQAQSKLKQLEKMQDLDELEAEKNFKLNFPHEKCPSKTPVRVDNIAFGYPETGLLFENLSFDINRAERIAIIGKNGKGKSTLLNILAKELSPNSGEIKFHDNVHIAHFGQTNINRLNLNNTIVDEIHSANMSMTTTQARSIAGTMMFEADKAEKKIKVLSGGERSRVLLGKLLTSPSNLLLLDEPTNHLDIESVDNLTQSIKNYPGSLVFVTHDEYMLHQLAKKFIVFRKDKAEVFLGTYQEFLDKIGWDENIEPVSSNNDQGLSFKQKKAMRAELVKTRAKARKPFQKIIDEREEMIVKAEEKLKILNEDLVKASHEQNANLITECSREIDICNKNIEKWFFELEEATQELDAVNSEFDPKIEELS